MTASPSKKPAVPTAKVSGWFSSAQSGRTSAITQLLEAYRPLLLRLANSQLDPELRQKEAASDLVQKSLIKATLAFSDCEFESVQDVISWLREILANEVVAAHRRYRQAKKRDARRERPISSAHSKMWIDYLSLRARTDEIASLSRAEEIAQVRAALDRLPLHYRQVIALRYSDELTFPEIARKLDRSEDAARMLWNRAINRLKQEYQRANSAAGDAGRVRF